MPALTPEQLREGPLADLIETLTETDAVLEALAGNQRCGAAVQVLADELERARQRLQRPWRRLRLALPPLSAALPRRPEGQDR